MVSEHRQRLPHEALIEAELAGIGGQMMAYTNTAAPSEKIAAGYFLQACLRASGILQKDFAAYIGIDAGNISAILKGRRKITPNLATSLESIFGIDAGLWLQVQSKNELMELKKVTPLTPRLSLSEMLRKVG